MQVKLDISAFHASTWLTRLTLAGLFTGIAIAFYGILINVEYRWIKVLNVQTIAGQDIWSRAVLIDTPDRPRLIRTSDRLLWVEDGELACVSKRRLIARRWLRYQLELPGYCRAQPKEGVSQYAPVPGLDRPLF